jgi:hypothetical protein
MRPIKIHPADYDKIDAILPVAGTLAPRWAWTASMRRYDLLMH